ncbi:unnamed protein product, partial [Ectocarpus fasciculatus]
CATSVAKTRCCRHHTLMNVTWGEFPLQLPRDILGARSTVLPDEISQSRPGPVGGHLEIGRVLTSVDAHVSPPYFRHGSKVLPGLVDSLHANGLADAKSNSLDASGSQVTGTAQSSPAHNVSYPGQRHGMSFATSDSSSVQTYNFTGIDKTHGSINSKSSVSRRKRKHDWRPANRLPTSHGVSPPSPGRLRPASPWSERDMSSDCVMNRWTASFDADRARFQSISVMCEQRLRKACVMTEHAPMPDEFRTMAACEALGTMLPVFERYGSLVTLVMKELLRSVYEDPDLVIDQFLAWLHPDPSLQSARAPAEVMLLKSKPHFVRCRELQSQIASLQESLVLKEKHEGTLLNNLTSARNSMRSLLGKDSLLITRFIFRSWKAVVEDGSALRRRFQRTRLRIWFSGIRTRLTRRMNQEAKYQLGLRERELMLHASEKGKTKRGAGQPTSEPAEETPENARPASTCELIVASLLEQAKTLMTEVQDHRNGSRDNSVLMASVTKMALAAKLAENRIRLDIGDDLSIEDEDAGVGHSTAGTQTDPVSFDNRSGGRAPGGDSQAASSGSKEEPLTPKTSNNKLADEDNGGGRRKADGASEVWTRSATNGGEGLHHLSKLSRYALQAIVIPDFYTRKVVSDASDDLRRERRPEPREAIEAFMFESCGGDPFKSELKLATMKAAVRKHGSSGNHRISLFGTLVGWLHEQSYIPQARKALDLYLLVMMRVFNDRAHQLNARMVKGDGLAYVPLEAVAPVVEELLPIMDEGEHFQDRSHALSCSLEKPNGMWALSEARKVELTRSITALARPAGETYLGAQSYDEAYKTDSILQVLDIDIAMETIMNAWFEQRHENRRLLAKTIEAHRVMENGEQRLSFARFSDMLWQLSGYAMSTPTMHRLFKLTTVSDKENKKKFSFVQTSALAEHILRSVFHFTTDEHRAVEILEEGDERHLKEQAQDNWQAICTKTTRKSRGQRLRLYINLQGRMRGWKTRYRHQMSTRIQQVSRGYIVRRRGGSTQRGRHRQ